MEFQGNGKIFIIDPKKWVISVESFNSAAIYRTFDGGSPGAGGKLLIECPVTI